MSKMGDYYQEQSELNDWDKVDRFYLEKEDKIKLKIELVPKTAWYKNVRSAVKKETWDIIRKDCYKRANYKCEICNGVGENHPVECHEIWNYNDSQKIQKLIGLIALCPNCHKTKHPGLANIKGELNIVINQLMRVNGMSKIEARKYIKDAFDIWKDRSRYFWKCDITYLENYKRSKATDEDVFQG